MTKRLVPLRRLIRDAEELGDDPESLYVNPDDVVELEEADEEEE